MGFCSGCSHFFQSLDTSNSRCGRCEIAPPKSNRDTWPQCSQCGRVFEHLAVEVCGHCVQGRAVNAGGPSVSAAIQYAAENPVDPRTFNQPGVIPYANPLIPDSAAAATLAQNGYLQQEAQRIANSVRAGYTNALLNAAPGMKLGKPRVGGPVLQAVSIPKYKIVVRNIFNKDRKKVQHVAKMLNYTSGTPWEEIMKDIIAVLDKVYIETYQFRIRSHEQFKLAYARHQTEIPEYHRQDTMGKVWQDAIETKGLYVSTQDLKLFKIELIAFVQYPNEPDDDLSLDGEVDTPTNLGMRTQVQGSSNKRQRSLSTTQGLERGHISKRAARDTRKTGASAYITRLEDSVLETGYKVIRIYIALSPRDEPEKKVRRIQLTDSFSVNVEDDKFASGATKHAFKLRFCNADPRIYAAKRFFNIGQNELRVSDEQNLLHLEKELVLNAIAKQSLERFNALVVKKSLNTFDLEIAESFILKVAEGADAGLSWIVDPYIGSGQVQKFSGTDQAGTNRDLAGMTCDAFAHFSLHDSEEQFVFVDIQGIISTTRLFGAKRANGRQCLVLFDMLAHSVTLDNETSMGLGDQGSRGIKKFKQQHVCNAFCTALGLQNLAQSSPLSDDDEDDTQGPGLEYVEKEKGTSSTVNITDA